MKNILDEIRKFSVPELCDGAVNYNTMDYNLKPLVTTKKIVGRAVTVNVPKGESAIITKAIDNIKEGEIIVIAGQGSCSSSYWGDHRSLCAKLKGAEGVVIDGAFRDIDECEKVGFPIYAKGVTPGAGGKNDVGEINVTVNCAGVEVMPGDIIVGDRNGVCVIKLEDVDRVLDGAKRKIEAENNTVEEMNRTGKVITRIVVK